MKTRKRLIAAFLLPASLVYLALLSSAGCLGFVLQLIRLVGFWSKHGVHGVGELY